MSEPQVSKPSKYFVPISTTVRRMVNASRMRVELFLEEADSWYLILRHPLGSMSKIRYTRMDDGSVSVQGTWWQDKHEEHLRISEEFEERRVAYDVAEIEACTQAMLAQIHANAAGVGA